MALQTKTFTAGSFDRYTGTSNGYVLDLILTEESADQLTNTSTVAYKLQLRSGPSNRFNGYLRSQVTLGGETVALNEMHTITAAYDQTYQLLSGSCTVPHDPDGSLTLSAAGTVTMLGETMTNPYAPPDMTVQAQLALTAIPRASSIAATAAYIGDSATLAVGRKSAAYSHTIFYQFGNLSGYLADAAGTRSDQPVRLTDTALLFPIPEAFYGQIPDAPSGICTLKCTTFSGDVQIGEPQTAAFTVTADPARCGPTVTGTVADENPATLALTGSDQILVQGASDARCAVQAGANCGASIAALYVNGAPMDSESCTLTAVTTDVITFRAVDSRGYSAQYTVPGLQLVPYVPLQFYASAARTDPTSGGATLTLQGKWYNGRLGQASNALSAQYRIDGGSWQETAVPTQGGDLSAQISLTGLDYRTGHTIDVQLSDVLQTRSQTLTVSKGIPVFDWGEEDFAFHVPVIFTASDGTEFILDRIDGQLVAREI